AVARGQAGGGRGVGGDETTQGAAAAGAGGGEAIMNTPQLVALALDPSKILEALGKHADPWQRDVMLSREKQLLLNCCRQSGKSTVVAALALHTALFTPGSLTVVLSPTQRQSAELGRKIYEAYHAVGRPLGAITENKGELELE